MTTEKKMKIVRMNRDEAIAVNSYVNDNKINLANLTRTEFTRKVTEALGFQHLTVGALESTRLKYAIPVKPERKPRVNPSQIQMPLKVADPDILAKLNKIENLLQRLVDAIPLARPAFARILP
jgi:hypothetical protein